jgi:hypothetical protein
MIFGKDRAPYRLRLDSEQHVWIAVVIDWQHAA